MTESMYGFHTGQIVRDRHTGKLCKVCSLGEYNGVPYADVGFFYSKPSSPLHSIMKRIELLSRLEHVKEEEDEAVQG